MSRNEMSRDKIGSDEIGSSRMRIAIFHDFYGSIGGGEKLALEMAKGLHADIITSEINAKNLKKINPGVKVIALIHDAILIEYPVDEADDE